MHYVLLHLGKQATNPRDGANRCLTFNYRHLLKCYPHHDFNQGGDFYRWVYSQRSQPHSLTSVSLCLFQVPACMFASAYVKPAKTKWHTALLDCQLWQIAGCPLPEMQIVCSASASCLLPASLSLLVLAAVLQGVGGSQFPHP